MRYLALASDYDGTLATGGQVGGEVLKALKRLRDSGRRLLLVSGRELGELLELFPHVRLFDRVIAENGALLYRPESREEKWLAEPPPEQFAQRLRERGVAPLHQGGVIVATREPNESIVLETIRELGLELQVIFNKGAVMVLPSGVNKGTALTVALRELGLSGHDCVGVGDAENDHAFLSLCECAVAVANALPTVQQQADLVTRGAQGDGLLELIARLLENDLADLAPRLHRHDIPVGETTDGSSVHLRGYGEVALLAGPSASAKSAATTAILERIVDKAYQFCLLDPEGNHESFPRAISLGTRDRAPAADEVLKVLINPEENAIANLVATPVQERPSAFASFWPRIQEMRARTGRPHWIVLDEAHHLVPAPCRAAPETVPRQMAGLLLVTDNPSHLAPAVLSSVRILLALGEGAEETVRDFARALGIEAPAVDSSLERAEAILWRPGPSMAPVRMRLARRT